VRNAVWVLVTVVLVLGLPFVGLANHEDVEETAMGFGFGGLLIGLFNIELGSENEADTVNGILAANGYAPLPYQMITFGGGGGGGVIGGFSFGGSGWGGSIDSLREGKKAELSLGFGGMDIAYVVGGNERSLLLIGAVLGGGGLDLKLRNRIPTSFEDAVADPTTVTLSQGFFAVEPYVCFQVQPPVCRPLHRPWRDRTAKRKRGYQRHPGRGSLTTAKDNAGTCTLGKQVAFPKRQTGEAI